VSKGFAAVLAAAVVVGLGAGVGAAYLMDDSRAAATSVGGVSAAAAPGGFAGAAFGVKPGGQGGGAQVAAKPNGPGGNAGTVEKVDGDVATVRTNSGSSVEVQLTGATIQRQVKASVGDLKVGDVVVGRGQPDAQGVLKLQALQVLPPGRGPGGRGSANGSGQEQATGGQGRPPGAGGGGQPQATGAQRGQGAGFGGGGFVGGSITKIDDRTLTLTAPNGGSTTATLADDAQIERVVPAAASDLKSGTAVAVNRGQGGTVVTITST